MMRFHASKKIAAAGILFLILVILAVYMWRQEAVAPEVVPINNFNDCEQASYPIAESYPRQCRTPDGRVFIEEVDPPTTELGGCRDNENCPLGQFCNQGVCQSATYAYGCQVDEDCLLVNQDLAFSCCYAGACQAINYAEDKWIAVNVDDYSRQRSRYCPADDSCGPMPGCPAQYTPSNFVARCQAGSCVKIESQPGQVTGDKCVDACGDRTCQVLTSCQGPSCICPETIESCPDDCQLQYLPD